jgi:hypothetical protein
MCTLCGGLMGGRHWADTGRNTQALRRERGARIRLLNRILGHYEVAVRAWGSDGYLLTGKRVPSQLADNLPSLWSKVEQTRGVHCNPLDEDLLAALSAEAVRS